MAKTAKSSTAKTKAAATKKKAPTAAKTTKKASTTHVAPRAKAKAAPAQHKKAVRSSYTAPFMVIRFSRESLYWLIFGAVAIVFALWVISLQQRVNDLYDQINSLNNTSQVLDIKQRYYAQHPDKIPAKITVPTSTNAS